jgi:hypothetical protein
MISSIDGQYQLEGAREFIHGSSPRNMLERSKGQIHR